MTELQKFFYPNGAIRCIADDAGVKEIGQRVQNGAIIFIQQEYETFLLCRFNGHSIKAQFEDEGIVWERVCK